PSSPSPISTLSLHDALPISDTQARRGVPQAHHVHALLTRGVLVLEELLPGIGADLLSQGAHAGDLLGNVRWYLQRRMLKQVRAGDRKSTRLNSSHLGISYAV